MKPVCSIPFCYTRKSETISIHAFPNNYNLRQEWLSTILEATGVEWYNIGEYSGVCSKHFKTECVIRQQDGRNVLKRGSVPTIFEPQNGRNRWPTRQRKMNRVTDWVFSENALSGNEISCRTCSANLCTSHKFHMHDNIPGSDIKMKDMIILLVPEMKYILTKTDIICDECREILIQCAQFQKTCILINSTFQEKPRTYEKRRTPRVIIEDNVSLGDQDESNGIGDNSRSENITLLDEPSSPPVEDTINVENIPRSESITLLDEESLPALENTINDDNNYHFVESESDPEIADQILDESRDASVIPPDSQVDEENTSRNLEVIKNVQDAIVEGISTDNTTCPETEINTLSDAESSSVMEGVDNVRHNNVSEYDKSFIQSIPELFNDFPDHGRILSFVQPEERDFEKFINILTSNGVNVCQSVNYKTGVNNRKRIILLGETLSCHICGKSFSNTISYAEHLKTHQLKPRRRYSPRVFRNGDLKCGSCLTTLSTQEDIEYHRKIHPQFICELCGKRSSTSQGLHVHKLVHKEKDLICEQCGKLFRSPLALSYHINSHNKGNYTCRRCEKIFNSKQNLKDHMRSTHDIDPLNKKGQPIKHTKRCKKCGRQHIPTKSCERSNTKSRRVTRSSKNKDPYKCHICSKVFPEYVRFEIHMRMHNRSNRYPCDRCQKTFSCQSRKDRHMEIVHRKSKKNMCMICLEQFITREELVAHVEEHIENVYKCDICGETFEKDDQLNHHLETNHSVTEDESTMVEVANSTSTLGLVNS